MSTDAPSLTHDHIHLPDDLATCQQMLRELFSTVAELRATIDKQQAHIQYLVRMTFGRRSERVEGPTLFDGLAEPETETAPPTPEPEAESETVIKKRRGHGRRQRPDHLPRQRDVIDLSEAEKACPCCGEQRIRIGADLSERLDYQPASLFVHVIERPTYVCRHCEQQGDNIQAAQAPLPPTPLPRCLVEAGLLSHVIVSKWVDHLPLYRQESILGRLGWEVSRKTLCDQMMGCARLLTPFYELMCQRVRASFALHTDDSPVRLLNPLRTAYAWAYVGDLAAPNNLVQLQ